MKFTFGLTAASLMALASPASAALITGVTIANVSSQLTTDGFSRTAANLVSGAAFVIPNSTTTTVPDNFMWLTNGNGVVGGTPDPAPFVEFNLGAVYNLASITIWNYNEAPSQYLPRGVASADITYGTNATGPLLGNDGVQSIAEGSGTTTTNYSTTISLAGITAQYVELSAFTHFAGGDNNFFGLTQVQFNSAPPPAVPEPAAIAVLGAGVLGLLAMRRRSRA